MTMRVRRPWGKTEVRGVSRSEGAGCGGAQLILPREDIRGRHRLNGSRAVAQSSRSCRVRTARGRKDALPAAGLLGKDSSRPLPASEQPASGAGSAAPNKTASCSNIDQPTSFAGGRASTTWWW